MSIEDQPTQHMRRIVPPASADGEQDGSTEVLRLDDMFDGAVAPAPAAPTAPAAAAAPAAPATPAAPVYRPATAPAATPAPQRIGAVPVSASASNAQPGLAERVRGDAGAAWRGGLTRSRGWLSSGDNAVILATVLVALLLVVVVAAL